MIRRKHTVTPEKVYHLTIYSSSNSMLCRKFQTDFQRFIHFCKGFRVKMTDLVFQPFFIDGAQLFEKNHRISDNIIGRRVDLDVRRQFGFVHLGSNGGTDHRRAVLVADIVLNDEYRTDPALLASHYRTKIRVINISSSYIHILHTPIPMFCQNFSILCSDIYSISMIIRCMQVYKNFINECFYR